MKKWSALLHMAFYLMEYTLALSLRLLCLCSLLWRLILGICDGYAVQYIYNSKISNLALIVGDT